MSSSNLIVKIQHAKDWVLVCIPVRNKQRIVIMYLPNLKGRDQFVLMRSLIRNLRPRYKILATVEYNYIFACLFDIFHLEEWNSKCLTLH